MNSARSGDGVSPVADVKDTAAEALMDLFHHLAKLDGWAKIALDRLVVNPNDARATQELRLSMVHVAGLHPQFTRRLAEVLGHAPQIAGAPLPQQSAPAERAHSQNPA